MAVDKPPRRKNRTLTALERAYLWIRNLGLAYLVLCVSYGASELHDFLQAPPEVSMPDLMGTQQDDAQAQLDRLGLKYRIDSTERSDAYLTGEVMHQSIPAGIHTRQGRTVFLFVCSGPAHVMVPDLRMTTMTQATNTLSQLGLKIVTSSGVYSDTVPFDSVVNMAPAPGTQVEVGTTVALIMSNGPAADPGMDASSDSSSSTQPTAGGSDSTGVGSADTGNSGPGYPSSTGPNPGFPGAPATSPGDGGQQPGNGYPATAAGGSPPGGAAGGPGGGQGNNAPIIAPPLP